MINKPVLNLPPRELPSVPMSKKEMAEDTRDRVHLISKEFTDGFNFLQDYPKSVTFFGGTHFEESNPYYQKARSLAKKIVNELHYSVLTGGGPGVMEGANRGAFEAGGESIGLTIELPNHQVQNPYLTHYLDFYYFFSRKVCLSFSAEAYIFFPGGYGTLDEFFEIITLIQTGKIIKMPIIMVGSDFWNHIDDLIKNTLFKLGTVDKNDLSLYKISDDEDEILEIIRKAPIRETVKFTHKDLNEAGIEIES